MQPAGNPRATTMEQAPCVAHPAASAEESAMAGADAAAAARKTNARTMALAALAPLPPHSSAASHSETVRGVSAVVHPSIAPAAAPLAAITGDASTCAGEASESAIARTVMVEAP
eukprot:scaffold52900_cov23-Tisochrysis_lutea.AAC.2